MLKAAFVGLTTLGCLVLSSLVRAQATSEGMKTLSSTLSPHGMPLSNTPSTPVSGGFSGGGVEDVAISLSIVLLVILFLAWLAKRFLPSLSVVDRKAMKVLAVLPLGGKERVLLVDVAGVQMVLGVSQAGVNCLHVFPEAVIKNTSAPDPERFRSLLQSFKNNKEAP